MTDALYDRVGGMPFFESLVARFYEGVATDEILRPMYPERLEPAQERLTLFLAQYFGGPRTYEERRGDPLLRLRHLKFPIDKAAKDAWLAQMRAALSTLSIDAADEAELLDYLSTTARFLMNRGLAIAGN